MPGSPGLEVAATIHHRHPETCGIGSARLLQEEKTDSKLTLSGTVKGLKQPSNTPGSKLEQGFCFSIMPKPFSPSRGMKITFNEYFLCSTVMKLCHEI